jgi:hypothetical protein
VVIQALIAFKDAVLLTEEAEEAYYTGDDDDWLKWDYKDRALLQEDSRNKLFVILYGGKESDYGLCLYWSSINSQN